MLRDLFPSYYRPTKGEFDRLWDECIFTFDTNVLLHIYRYTPDTRARLFDVLGRLRTRIWIPHQAAMEFSIRRSEVIIDQFIAYETIREQLTKLIDPIQTKLQEYKRHSYFGNGEEFLQHLQGGIEKALASLEEAKAKEPDIGDDHLLNEVSHLFEERIGKPFSPERLEEIYKEGEERYNKEIPPGYKDAAEKRGNEKYGDLVIWLQLIEYALAEKKPIILTTDDIKEDWWLEYKGRKIGPRRELVAEMLDKANVQFYMYQSERFLQLAQEYLNIRDQQAAKVVEEAREVRQTLDMLTRTVEERMLLEDLLNRSPRTELEEIILRERLEDERFAHDRAADRLHEGMAMAYHHLHSIDPMIRREVVRAIKEYWVLGGQSLPIESTRILERLEKVGLDVGLYALSSVFDALEMLGCITVVRYRDSEGIKKHGVVTITSANVDCLRPYAG